MKDKHKDMIKIYPLSYLCTHDLTEEDLFFIFDTPSLKYSLIYGMFQFMNNEKSLSEIKNIVKTNKWYNETKWSKPERDNFVNIIKDIYKNIYVYSDERALAESQMWVNIYGFALK